MDFDRYRDWTHKSRWDITTDKKVQDLTPGDILRVDLGGMSFRPTLVVTIPFTSASRYKPLSVPD